MRKRQVRKALSAAGKVCYAQSGITGLETAIVLIAFIVVAAVFAFAVLTTGLFTTERAKDTTVSAVGEAQSTLSPKGAVIAEANGTLTGVNMIKFKLANASGAEGVDLAGATTLLTYTDVNQSVNMTYDRDATFLGFPCAGIDADDDDVCWSHDWIIGDGDTIGGGEVVELEIWLDEMANDLQMNQQFKIEVIPGQGAVIPVSRKTPLELFAVMSLD